MYGSPAKLCQGAGLSPHIKKRSGGGNHRLPKAQEGEEHERVILPPLLLGRCGGSPPRFFFKFEHFYEYFNGGLKRLGLDSSRFSHYFFLEKLCLGE